MATNKIWTHDHIAVINYFRMRSYKKASSVVYCYTVYFKSLLNLHSCWITINTFRSDRKLSALFNKLSKQIKTLWNWYKLNKQKRLKNIQSACNKYNF